MSNLNTNVREDRIQSDKRELAIKGHIHRDLAVTARVQAQECRIHEGRGSTGKKTKNQDNLGRNMYLYGLVDYKEFNPRTSTAL